MMDQELKWGQQEDLNLSRAVKWVTAFGRLARTSTGMCPGLMRKMYTAIAVPKITYVADL